MRNDRFDNPDSGALDRSTQRLREARRVIVLTGAGVSAESDVPTFRGPGGLWRRYRSEELATPEAFARDPRLVWEWYAWRRDRIASVAPNAAHRAIAALDRRFPDFLLATQNVDGLHEVAGSRRMVELHGSLWRMRCLRCGAIKDDRRSPLPRLPPQCACGGVLRPDVVWFGEALPEEALKSAFDAAGAADLALVVGTSSLVYPAASIPRLARKAGAFVIEINTEPTPLTPTADVFLRGPATKWLPPLIEEK
ncbi:MAG: NAD-dependent deacylase [Vicinamibacteria bacterium]|nr:NAD-dependent deacylase [Vicinamibacteria bacterium]